MHSCISRRVTTKVECAALIYHQVSALTSSCHPKLPFLGLFRSCFSCDCGAASSRPGNEPKSVEASSCRDMSATASAASSSGYSKVPGWMGFKRGISSSGVSSGVSCIITYARVFAQDYGDTIFVWYADQSTAMMWCEKQRRRQQQQCTCR